jgi:hypothetical protein
LIASAPVVLEAACGCSGSRQALALATIPDNASGISGMTVSEPVNRICYDLKLMRCAERSKNAHEDADDQERKANHPEGQGFELPFANVSEVQPRLHPKKQPGDLTQQKEYTKNHKQPARKPQDASGSSV